MQVVDVNGNVYSEDNLEIVDINGKLKGLPATYFVEENNVRSWTLTGQILAVGTQDSAPTGLFFKPDGTKIYLIGGTNERVNQYTLSTPWNITTAVVDATSLSIQIYDTAMNDIYISPDGTILYAVGSTNDRVYRFNLTVPWDVSTGVYQNFLAVGAFSTLPNGLYFKPDGTRLFIMGDGTDTVYTVDMSIAWDITTGVLVSSLPVTPFVTGGSAISFNDGGTVMYLLGTGGDDITQYNLSTAWDITTAVRITESFRFNAEIAPGGLYYSESYGVAYIVGSGVDTIYGLNTTTNLITTDDSLDAREVFVNERLQVQGTAFFAQPVTTLSTITAGSSITSAGNLFVASRGQIGFADNIGNSSTPSTHNFANGVTGSLGTKIANIGNNGLLGSKTVINLGVSTDTTVNSLAGTNNFNHNVNIGGVLATEGRIITNPPTGAIEFQDTFTEATTVALQSHIPNIGTGWTKTYAGATTNVNVFSAGYASPAITVSNAGVIYTANNVLSTADYEVSTTITSWTSGDDVLWVYFRFQDLNNYYAFRVSLTTTDFRLYKRVGGVLTAIFTLVGFIPTNTTQVFTVRVIGGYISLFLNGVLYGTYYDTDITLPGKCGIGFGNTGVGLTADDMSAVWRLDDFKVQVYTPTDLAGTSYVNNGSFVVGSTTANPSAKLEVVSTDQGFLLPRMTTAQKEAIVSPSTSLMVYDTDNGVIETYDLFWGWMPIANQNQWMRKWGMEYWHDFGLNNGFNDGVISTWSTNGGGQGIAANPTPSDLNYIGLQGIRTGTATNGGAQIRTDVNIGRYNKFGGGKLQFETRIYIRDILSTATDRYNVIAGLSLNVTSTITAGCCFVYDEGGIGTGTLATPNWQIITAYSSVRSVYDTGIVVSPNTFYSFRINVNDNATRVEYYINNILVLSETTNIPVESSNGNQPIITITKSAGTTDLGIFVDYLGIKKKFRTPR